MLEVHQSSTRGFSLIELVVAVAILSLIASGSMLVLSGGLRKSQQNASFARFKDLHHRLCGFARTSPCSVIFDFHQASASFTWAEQTRTIEMPGLGAVVVGATIQDHGEIKIQYLGGGPPDYAILTGIGSSRRWLIIHAGTGQVLLEDFIQGDASKIATLQANWANAH